MCGLVFTGGKTSLTSADVELFEQMGISDTLRGAHSTGVCAVYKPYNGDWFSKVTKAAADGYDFFRSKEWEETAGHPAETKGTVSNTTYISKVIPKALFGHNRYATQGAINALNAHPFQHGHITLAHNGTLNNWKALEGAHQFTVDSEAVAYSVSQVGFEETLKKLNGAFTLIWLDSNEKTLNIIRNTQRPFFLAQTSIGDWFGASEEGLVRWILGRGKSPRTISKAFECEVGVQYIFDVSNGCVLKEERKHELPTFPVQTQSYSGGYYSGYGSGYGSRTQEDDYSRYWPSNRKQAKVEEKKEEKALSTGGSLEERLKVLTDRVGLPGVKLGSEIRFEMVSSHPYPAGNGKSKIIGWLPDGLEFAEIQVHNIDEKVFADDAVGYGILVSGYIDPESNTITLILRSDRGDLQKTTFDYDKEDEQDFSFLEDMRDELDETRELMSGERFSAHEWHKSHHNTCAMCNNPIPFEEIEVASIENGYCFCGDCTEAVMVRGKTEQEKRIAAAVEIYCNACGTHHKQNVLDGNMTHAEWSSLAVSCQWKISFKEKFTGQNQRPILTLVKTDKPKAESEHLCVACDTKVPKSMMSISPDLCQTCSDRFNAAVGSATEDNGGRKTLANGMKVTPEQWRKMCTCGQCGSNITWFFADKVKFNGSNPVCHSCKA